MPTSRFHAAALLLCLPCLCWAGSGTEPLDLARKFDFASSPASNLGAYVSTQAEGKLKGMKRVAITNMCVQFVNSKSASGFSSGGTRSYSRSVEGGIPGGLDEARMQAVADGWLAQIEADLAAAGLTVVPYEELAGNDLFKKFAAKYDTGIREGARSSTNNSKGDTGETVVYVSPKGRPFAPDCGTISPASTGTFVRMSYPLDAEFLTISAVVDMGQASASGGLLRGARAGLVYAQFLRAGDSQFQFIGKSGPGARIWLNRSIVPQANPFAEGGEEHRERSGEYDAASGATTMGTTTTSAVAFDQDLYYRNAADSLKAMHQMFLQKLPH